MREGNDKEGGGGGGGGWSCPIGVCNVRLCICIRTPRFLPGYTGAQRGERDCVTLYTLCNTQGGEVKGLKRILHE